MADILKRTCQDNTGRYEVVGNMSDEYLKTNAYITIIVHTDDGVKMVWDVQRSGISAPGTVERAVYQYQGKYYIYEGGWLIPIKQWYSDNGRR